MSSTLPNFPAYASNFNWNCKINYSHYFENNIDNETERYFKIIDTYNNTCGKFYESDLYNDLITNPYTKDAQYSCLPAYLFYYCDITDLDSETNCRNSTYNEHAYL